MRGEGGGHVADESKVRCKQLLCEGCKVPC
jgi:hypothetical protein